MSQLRTLALLLKKKTILQIANASTSLINVKFLILANNLTKQLRNKFGSMCISKSGSRLKFYEVNF